MSLLVAVRLSSYFKNFPTAKPGRDILFSDAICAIQRKRKGVFVFSLTSMKTQKDREVIKRR